MPLRALLPPAWKLPVATEENDNDALALQRLLLQCLAKSGVQRRLVQPARVLDPRWLLLGGWMINDITAGRSCFQRSNPHRQQFVDRGQFGNLLP